MNEFIILGADVSRVEFRGIIELSCNTYIRLYSFLWYVVSTELEDSFPSHVLWHDWQREMPILHKRVKQWKRPGKKTLVNERASNLSSLHGARRSSSYGTITWHVFHAGTRFETSNADRGTVTRVRALKAQSVQSTIPNATVVLANLLKSLLHANVKHRFSWSNNSAHECGIDLSSTVYTIGIRNW